MGSCCRRWITLAVTEGPRFRTPEDPEEDTRAPSPRQSTAGSSSRRGPRLMMSGPSGGDGTGATLDTRTVAGFLAACACAAPVGRVVDPGRAGTRGALLPSSNLWPDLGAQREWHGGGGARQSESGWDAPRFEPCREQNTNAAPLGPESPGHLSDLRGFLGGLRQASRSDYLSQRH